MFKFFQSKQYLFFSAGIFLAVMVFLSAAAAVNAQGGGGNSCTGYENQCVGINQYCNDQGVIEPGHGCCTPENACASCNMSCDADGNNTHNDANCNYLCSSNADFIENQIDTAQDAYFWIGHDGKLGLDNDQYIYFDPQATGASENSIFVLSQPATGTSFIKLQLNEGGTTTDKFVVTKGGDELHHGMTYIEGMDALGGISRLSINYAPWMIGDESLKVANAIIGDDDDENALIYGTLADEVDTGGNFLVFQTYSCANGNIDPPPQGIPDVFSFWQGMLQFLQPGTALADMQDPAVGLPEQILPFQANPYQPNQPPRCTEGDGLYKQVFKVTKNGSLAVGGSLTLHGSIYNGLPMFPVIIDDEEGFQVNYSSKFRATSMFGHNDLILDAGQNLIYGNIDNASSNYINTSLLKLQNENVDQFVVDTAGNLTINGTIKFTDFEQPACNSSNEGRIGYFRRCQNKVDMSAVAVCMKIKYNPIKYDWSYIVYHTWSVIDCGAPD